MAISYALELEAEVEPVRLLHIISDRLGLKQQKDMLKGLGITVYAYCPDDSDKSLAEQEFGFRPGVCAGFRINSNSGYEEGMRSVLQASLTLLGEVPGDAVLLFNYETVLFQRTGGRFIADNNIETFAASELALYYESMKNGIPPNIAYEFADHEELTAFWDKTSEDNGIFPSDQVRDEWVSAKTG